jgi:hypothetical protein
VYRIRIESWNLEKGLELLVSGIHTTTNWENQK